MISFSVIIATRSISDFLKESIKNLKLLDHDNFQVIIVTDVKESFDFNGDTRFILTDSRGEGNPSLKRNIAADIATGDVLVFLDDDAYPSKTWLTEASAIFEDPSVYALGGPAMTPPDAGLLEQGSGQVLKSFLASGGTIYRHIPLKAREIDDYPTVNLFVRKDAFKAVGGFGIEFWPGEDTKLCLDLIKLYGRKFIYSPKPIVYHHRRNLFRPHLKQISRYGRHRGQYARIFPETSRTFSYFVPALFVFGLMFGPLTYFVSPYLYRLYVGVVGLYLMLVLYESIKAAIETKKQVMLLYVALGIMLTHVVYGLNFIFGYLKRPKLKLKAVDPATGNYSEG